MNLLIMPNDIIYYISRFLSITDKIAWRETCIELNSSVNFMEIRIEKMNIKFDRLLNGRIYILCRLRLAALCGLHNHTIADIWSWVNSLGDITVDALPILRQIGRTIYRNSLT